MQCKTCGAADKAEIAVRTTLRAAGSSTRCHRLECGHAWHVGHAASRVEVTEPTHCTCGEVTTVNGLLVEGHRHAALRNELTEDAFRQWLNEVLQVLDGIPAESGASSLLHSATLAAKSKTSSMSEKTNKLNKLLARAIQALS